MKQVLFLNDHRVLCVTDLCSFGTKN